MSEFEGESEEVHADTRGLKLLISHTNDGFYTVIVIINPNLDIKPAEIPFKLGKPVHFTSASGEEMEASFYNYTSK